MAMLFSMGMEVIMNRLSVNMHVLVDEVDTKEKCHII
jgi:hypothetical protein